LQVFRRGPRLHRSRATLPGCTCIRAAYVAERPMLPPPNVEEQTSVEFPIRTLSADADDGTRRFCTPAHGVAAGFICSRPMIPIKLCAQEVAEFVYARDVVARRPQLSSADRDAAIRASASRIPATAVSSPCSGSTSTSLTWSSGTVPSIKASSSSSSAEIFRSAPQAR
jgi:hypothetical protein